jgi:hypothetical protein
MQYRRLFRPGSGIGFRHNHFRREHFGLINATTADVNLDVTGSTIRGIGESPANGAQHGVAVYS